MGRRKYDRPTYRDPNRFIVADGLLYIELRSRNGDVVAIAITDAVGCEDIVQRKWYLHSSGYVATRGSKGSTYLHRLVVGSVCDGTHVDHINGDKLDNRKSNLRPCSPSQNSSNTGPKKSSKTGVKGVHLFKGGPKYAAQITRNRKVFHLGVFDTVGEAKAAYDSKAAELFGEFARLP